VVDGHAFDFTDDLVGSGIDQVNIVAPGIRLQDSDLSGDKTRDEAEENAGNDQMTHDPAPWSGGA
jgi:hypothetical protein